MKRLYDIDYYKHSTRNYEKYTTHIILARNDSSSQSEEMDALSCASDSNSLNGDYMKAAVIRNHSNHNLNNDDLEMSLNSNSSNISQSKDQSNISSTLNNNNNGTNEDKNLFQNLSQSKPYSFLQSFLKNQLNNSALKSSFSVSSGLSSFYNTNTNTPKSNESFGQGNDQNKSIASSNGLNKNGPHSKERYL